MPDSAMFQRDPRERAPRARGSELRHHDLTVVARIELPGDVVAEICGDQRETLLRASGFALGSLFLDVARDADHQYGCGQSCNSIFHEPPLSELVGPWTAQVAW